MRKTICNPVTNNMDNRYDDCDDSLFDDSVNDHDLDRDEPYFSLDDCYDAEGNFDADRLEDAILDGEYVPEDW